MPTDVLVPPLGTNVDVLILTEWFHAEGEAVEEGKPLFAVQTDKAVLDVESPASGILLRVTAAPGAEVTALTRIAVIAAPDEVLASAPAPTAATGAAIAPAWMAPASIAAARPELEDTGRIFISPRARRLAETSGVDWRSLRGTGPEEAIVERDIRRQMNR